MPVIKSAKKKLRQDRKKEKANKILKKAYRNALKDAATSKKTEEIKKAVKFVDKAAKKKIIHKNKAARIKSSLSKLIKNVTKKETVGKKTTPSKKTVKKKK